MPKRFYRFYYPPAKALDYDTFWDSKIIQDFSFPNPLVNYIILKPSYPNAYQKLLESCKYFYAKKPVIVVQEMIHTCSSNWFFQHLQSSKIKLSASPNFGKNAFDVTKIDEKLWLLNSFYIDKNWKNTINAASLLCPKIYRCDVTYLLMFWQRLTLSEFKMLTPCAKSCNFYNVIITDDENKDVEILLEILLQNLPKVIRFTL